jgi:hypothetical protein
MIIDDTFYPKGSNLKTKFYYQVLKFAYPYSFWQTDKFDINASTGVYFFDVDLKITPVEGEKEGESGTAPFQMIGLNTNYRISDRQTLTAGYECFTYGQSDVEGEPIDIGVGLEYKAFSRISLGIGYNSVEIDAKYSDDNDEFEYDGILAHIIYSF